MVFFNCNACGESLKKNQVEKHCFKCRGCQSLSCVDCGKDFWGNDYQEHTKCISEEEKYSGKDFKPKANANKGERKQEAWVQQVQSAIDKARTNPKLRSVLLQIKDCSNIPRKKAKFENFLRNSMRIHDSAIITQSWELISAEMQAQKEAPVNGTEATSEVKDSAGQAEPQEARGEEATERKLNKRERKEERQNKASKKEKKHKDSQKNGVENDEENEPSQKKKKSKKRKHEDVEEEMPEETVHKKKSKKRKHRESEEVENEADEETEEPQTKKSKHKKDVETSQEEAAEEPAGKFRWEDTILQCLQAANDNQLSLKKLKKKVMAQFWSQGGDRRLQTEERALAKFHKKVSKNPRFKVLKDSVKLME